MTMSFHEMDGGSLDQIVDWFLDRGIRTYAALEDFEIPEFRERFSGARRLAALDGLPEAVFEDPGRVLVFDLTRTKGAVREPRLVRGLATTWKAIPPGAPPTLVIGRGTLGS